MTLFRTEVQTLPGVPTSTVITKTMVALLEPLVEGGLEVADGPVLTAPNLAADLAAIIESRPQFSGRGSGKTEFTMRWANTVNDITLTGELRTYTDRSPDDVEPLVAALIDAAQLTGSPFAFLDPFEGGFRERSNQHRDAYQQDKQGRDRMFGLLRGFTGIPWRTVIGPAGVDFFGDDALAQLPEALARRLAPGYWLLTPCQDPSDWDAGAYCDGERRIVETLGAAKFFDPATDTLPAEVPDLPELSPVAHTIRRRDDNGDLQWETLA